jgi:hypothetical protein
MKSAAQMKSSHGSDEIAAAIRWISFNPKRSFGLHPSKTDFITT